MHKKKYTYCAGAAKAYITTSTGKMFLHLKYRRESANLACNYVDM
jgi:hypothetical protein